MMVPWSPVIPVEMVPFEPGGDRFLRRVTLLTSNRGDSEHPRSIYAQADSRSRDHAESPSSAIPEWRVARRKAQACEISPRPKDAATRDGVVATEVVKSSIEGAIAVWLVWSVPARSRS